MNKPQTALSPEEIFNEAIAESGPSLTAGELRLLTSGLSLLRSAQEKKLNEIELKAISSMITFVAYTQGTNEAMVESVLCAVFGAENIKAISSRRYDAVMDFLLHVKMANIVN